MIQLILIIVETGRNSSTDAALLRCGTRPVAFLPQAMRRSARFGTKPHAFVSSAPRHCHRTATNGNGTLMAVLRLPDASARFPEFASF
jgi:hypothetical protein